MSHENTVVWIKDILVPRMLENVSKWKGASVTDCQIVPLIMNKDGFASLLYSLVLTLNVGGKQDIYNLIVKIIFTDEILRATFQSEKQFANEIYFYSRIVPLFESIEQGHTIIDSLFPMYYYSSASSVSEYKEENGFIVLENLKPRGFRLGDRESLDLEHTISALQHIGRFHAFSYAYKHLRKETFFGEVVSRIYETVQPADYCKCVEVHNNRVSKALRSMLPEDPIAEILERKIYDPTVFENLITPKEPLAVLCHGDFCRNNMMYNYNNENKPSELKMLDFQTMRYASPAIDLSFFLFMNTTAALRKQYWDLLLESYHKEVRSSLAQLLGKDDKDLEPCYSLEAFKEDFRQHALYGYMITVTFLPCMLGTDEDREEMVRSWYENPETTTSQRQEITDRIGGARATEALVSLVLEMREKTYL